MAGTVQIALHESIPYLAGNVRLQSTLLARAAHRIGSRALCVASLAPAQSKKPGIPLGNLDSPWYLLPLVGEAPELILYAVLQAVCTSAIALVSAWLFAKWDKVREAHLPGHGWLEFLLVLGCVTITTLLTVLLAMYVEGYAVFLVAVPAAALAGIAAWTTYRMLRRAGLTAPSSMGTARKES